MVPWPAMTSRVVEGVDEGAAFFAPEAERLGAGFVVAGAVQDDFGAVGARWRRL